MYYVYSAENVFPKQNKYKFHTRQQWHDSDSGNQTDARASLSHCMNMLLEYTEKNIMQNVF